MAGWIALLVLVGTSRVGLSRSMAPTDSLAERFGTFTLVVWARSSSASSTDSRSPITTSETIATGMIALVVGFGFWWIYFDVVGRRLPKSDGPALVWAVAIRGLLLAGAWGIEQMGPS